MSSREGDLPAVYVEWVDSTQMKGWQELDDARGLECLAMKTLGWLVNETEHAVTIVPTWAEGNYDCPIAIPTVAITGMWYVDLGVK